MRSIKLLLVALRDSVHHRALKNAAESSVPRDIRCDRRSGQLNQIWLNLSLIRQIRMNFEIRKSDRNPTTGTKSFEESLSIPSGLSPSIITLIISPPSFSSFRYVRSNSCCLANGAPIQLHPMVSPVVTPREIGTSCRSFQRRSRHGG